MKQNTAKARLFWLDLQSEVINAIENSGHSVIESIKLWQDTYRPLIVASLETDGDYSVTIGEFTIEWSVQK
jgi:hypothetical protein